MPHDRDNKGALWGAKERKTDKHPHFTGEAVIAGVAYRVAGWKRGPDDPPNWPALNMAFTPKDEEPKREAPKSQPDNAGFDDDIPF